MSAEGKSTIKVYYIQMYNKFLCMYVSWTAKCLHGQEVTAAVPCSEPRYNTKYTLSGVWKVKTFFQFLIK